MTREINKKVDAEIFREHKEYFLEHIDEFIIDPETREYVTTEYVDHQFFARRASSACPCESRIKKLEEVAFKFADVSHDNHLRIKKLEDFTLAHRRL